VQLTKQAFAYVSRSDNRRAGLAHARNSRETNRCSGRVDVSHSTDSFQAAGYDVQGLKESDLIDFTPSCDGRPSKR